MPRVERRILKEKAVLWERNGYDADGEPTVSAKREIPVRWEEKRTEMISDDGTPIAVDGTVFVDEDINTGSVLWKGKLKDTSPDPTENLMEVVARNLSPDMKGRNFKRSVGIKKWRRSLPTVS